ncbi:hypothetical protein F2Q69_00009159 [Brassica cretica]|uniref:Uncharacterized protein n=1 Tax=Brassica cretica TaxID=69181 RepID=A0A8S9PHN4_BRACR|nr:hypothetical protein F2Q69_00009159 [Brassica cretica]
MAVHTAIPIKDALHTEEYNEYYGEERATEYRGIRTEEDRLLHHSYRSRNATSIDRNIPTSIDTHHHQTNRKRASTDIAYYPSIDEGLDRSQEGNYLIGSWAHDRYHESYAVEIAIHEPRAERSIPEHQQRVTNSTTQLVKFHWEEKDENGVYRDDHGHARDVDGNIICVSKDDTRSLLERASIDEHSYLCLPEQARSFTQTKLVPEIYTKDEINEMPYGICGALEKNEDDFQMKLDGVYYPLNDSISWLTTCMEEMRQDIAKWSVYFARESCRGDEGPSIDDTDLVSIDGDAIIWAKHIL